MAKLTATLTQDQFAEFCCEIWNTPTPQGWKGRHENFWGGICKMQLNRRFVDGWQYCQSSFEISPRERLFTYTTTSGTYLDAHQKVLGHGEELPEICCTVEIPEDRSEGHHAGILERVLAGSTYFDWHSLYYSVEGTPAFDEARRRGMAIASDPEEIASVLAQKQEQEAKHAAKRALRPTLEGEDPYEYDDGVIDNGEEES